MHYLRTKSVNWVKNLRFILILSIAIQYIFLVELNWNFNILFLKSDLHGKQQLLFTYKMYCIQPGSVVRTSEDASRDVTINWGFRPSVLFVKIKKTMKLGTSITVRLSSLVIIRFYRIVPKWKLGKSEVQRKEMQLQSLFTPCKSKWKHVRHKEGKVVRFTYLWPVSFD